MNRDVYQELQNVQTRDELALVWKYYRLAKQMIDDRGWSAKDWPAVIEAFKTRAGELGIEWKGK